MKIALILTVALYTTLALAEFPNDFFYKIEGTCANPTKMNFWQAETAEAARIGLDQKGRPLEAYVSLQLFEDGTYWAIYGERALVEITEGGKVYAFVFEKRHIQGKWDMTDKTIYLEGLGEAVHSKYEALRPYPSLKITMKETFNSPLVMDKKINLTMMMTKEGPRGLYVYQYCQNQ